MGTESCDTWSEPDTTVSLLRLGLPRYLLEPQSREETDTEREGSHSVCLDPLGPLSSSLCSCPDDIWTLRQEVDQCRSRMAEYQALIQKLTAENLKMTGRELSFQTQLENARKLAEEERVGQGGGRNQGRVEDGDLSEETDQSSCHVS